MKAIARCMLPLVSVERMSRAVGLPSNAHTQQFKVGEPWDSPQEWSSAGVQCSYKNDLITWGDKCFRIQSKIKEKYLNPCVLVDFLKDSWHDLQCFHKHLLLCQSATEKEIITHFGCKARLAKNAIRLGVNSGILTKLKGGKCEIGSQPDIEEIKWENSQQECCSPVAVAAQKVRSPQDTNLSGRSKTIPTPQPCIESDSQALDSSNKTLPDLATNLSLRSPLPTLSFSQRLALTFPWLENEPDLMELAEACFLKDSDLFGSNVHLHSSLKMLTDSLAQTKELPSRKSSKRLQVWGIAAPGNLGMGTGTSPKTENGFSSWAITAEVRATQPKTGKKSLAKILGGIPINSATGLFQPAILDVHHVSGGRLYEKESPCLLSPGESGRKFSIVYRAADGDRLYHEQAPTLRSPNNAGNGAYKVREYDEQRGLGVSSSGAAAGETYLERPINATEAEQLMGWEVGSTAIGINQEGDEITISQTQRIKMLGNGIIPAEITDILTAIKPIFTRKLKSEISSGYDFAYRQLRQRGISHEACLSVINATARLAPPHQK